MSQSLILFYGETKYSILLKIFKNKSDAPKLNNYLIDWDYDTNMMKPGTYYYKEGEKIMSEYTINSKGFRGEEVNLVTDKYRIIALGGSTTISTEVNDHETYPAQLQSLLNKKGEKYEVLNMGFGSKSLNFQKKFLYSEVYKYKPQMIIIYNNRNNIMYDASSNLQENGSFLNFDTDNRIIKLHFVLQENIMTYRFFSKLYKRISGMTIDANYLYSPYSSIGVSEDYFLNGYTDTINQIIQFCKKNNIDKIVLVKQAYYFNPKISKELLTYNVKDLIELYKDNYLIKEYGVTEAENLWLVLGTILNKKIDEFRNNEKIIIVDPVLKLIEDENNFSDYIHLNSKGNLILSNEIYKTIKNVN